MNPNANPLDEFNAADEAWQRQLVAAFGNAAGDARYEPRGKGEPGSVMRAAYDRREAARVAAGY